VRTKTIGLDLFDDMSIVFRSDYNMYVVVIDWVLETWISGFRSCAMEKWVNKAS